MRRATISNIPNYNVIGTAGELPGSLRLTEQAPGGLPEKPHERPEDDINVKDEANAPDHAG